ncbi:MAG TPA: hotdog domain-containing protein [Acidimicrobiales bacterium]|jgi:fluoroacetyl-CoA thioesterase|nr:hotdog domain-containing protein [Acidimicrobiales bacterium]
MPAQPGATAAVDLVVTDDDTAVALGSGDVSVLGTPRILALAEEACCRAIVESLGADETTVGMRAQLDHLAPVKVGSKVFAEATLEKIEGRRLVFTVSVTDECGLVAAGRLTRVVVRRAEFLDKAR